MYKRVDDLKCFEYKGEILFYELKDVELKEYRGKEVASAYMTVYFEDGNIYDGGKVYGERYTVLYAMPEAAKRWFLGWDKNRNAE